MESNSNVVETPSKRLLLRTSIAFFVITIILLNIVDTAHSAKQSGIFGVGYGNNGDRFGSIVSCSESDVIHNFEGSTIQFEATLSDNSKIDKNSGISAGSWVIDFSLENSASPVRISGDIIKSSLNHNTYTLLGKETFDNVCNDIGNAITLTGNCGENTKIWFSDSNHQKVGSLTPPHGDEAYYLFGSKVNCN